MTPAYFNNFKGAAKKIEDIDLPRLGHKIGVGEDEIHAVMDIEAASSGFDRLGRPKILFERHWFYRLLSGSERQKAVNAGLAVKSWSRATYNQDQYKLLARAMAINPNAALQSASWGLGQVMGFNFRKVGYDSVEDMVKDFLEDEDNHLEAMINFIVNSGIDDDLRNHNWAGFARVYNGSGYKKNKYDTKLANAYYKWSKIRDTPWSFEDKTLNPVDEVPVEDLEEVAEKIPKEVPKEEPKEVVEETPKVVVEEVKPTFSIAELFIMLLKKLFGK